MVDQQSQIVTNSKRNRIDLSADATIEIIPTQFNPDIG